MNKKAKLYLTVSLTLVALGIIMTLTQQAAKLPVLYVFLPVGAVFFGLFLVSAFLGREAEQHAKEQEAFQKTVDKRPGSNSAASSSR
jgi:hypothetical protein